MSIHFHLRAIAPHHVRTIDADPRHVHACTYVAILPYEQLIARARELRMPAAVVASYPPPPDDLLPEVTIGQSWDVVRRVLAAQPDATLARAIDHGREVGAHDGGGWTADLPTLLEPSDVAAVAAALAALPLDRVVGELDAARVEGAYSASFFTGPEGSRRLLGVLRALAAVYADAASRGDAMLRWAT